jgi:hypothetical protein
VKIEDKRIKSKKPGWSRVAGGMELGDRVRGGGGS